MSFVPSSVSPTFHGVIWSAAASVAVYALPYASVANLANLDTPLRSPMFEYADGCWEKIIGPLAVK